MKLILSVDAVFQPLTGIGRYAWELASRLRKHPDLDAVRLFSMGRWVDDPASLLAPPEPGLMCRGVAVRARTILARQAWAVEAFRRVTPLLFARRLRSFGDHLFHSPNYFLPPLDGPAVVTVHDLSIYKYPEVHPAARRRYFEREFPRALSRARHLITDSEATRQEVAAYCGWPLHRITAIPLGVDGRFIPRPAAELGPALARYGLTPGGYALCVSTVEPRKKIDRLLTAYAALPAAMRGRYPLVLVGGRGWLSGAIHAQIEVGIAQGWVRYPGYVPEEDLPLIYAGARAFCFISIYEGFGLPVLEAMAAGIPVLVSDRSSLPEVCGDAGWQVDPDDVDAVREGLAKVLEDEPWRSVAKERGLARARGLGWDRCVAGTLEVYKKVLAT